MLSESTVCKIQTKICRLASGEGEEGVAAAAASFADAGLAAEPQRDAPRGDGLGMPERGRAVDGKRQEKAVIPSRVSLAYFLAFSLLEPTSAKL